MILFVYQSKTVKYLLTLMFFAAGSVVSEAKEQEKLNFHCQVAGNLCSISAICRSGTTGYPYQFLDTSHQYF